MPGPKPASKNPRKKRAAIKPEKEVVAAWQVATIPHPVTQKAAHICGGTNFHIRANHSKAIYAI